MIKFKFKIINMMIILIIKRTIQFIIYLIGAVNLILITMKIVLNKILTFKKTKKRLLQMKVKKIKVKMTKKIKVKMKMKKKMTKRSLNILKFLYIGQLFLINNEIIFRKFMLQMKIKKEKIMILIINI